MRLSIVTFIGCLLSSAMIGCCTTDDCITVCEDPAVPYMNPLGSVSYAHYHAMEANGEAADFVINRSDFESGSPDLTPAGRDHILEVGARMNATPFPVLIEPSDEGDDVDLHRKQIVTEILSQLGNADAAQRVMISRPYSDGIRAADLAAQH